MTELSDQLYDAIMHQMNKGDEAFEKEAFDLKVEKAPYYATLRKPAVHHNMGGLKIDTETHVINKQGQVIQGLYAA